jgi:nitric oxide reductase subunit B
MTPKKLWTWLAAVIIASFAVLIYYGVDIYRKIPPIPEKVITTEGQVLYTGQDVKDGQNVWQSIGGQTVGSIWGHGAYIAPDWTADYLHREAVLLLDELAKKDNKVYHNLPDEEQARYKILLQKELRTNTFDEASNTIVISPERAKVQRELAAYYKKLFMGDPSMNKLRDAYAIPVNTVKDIGRMEKRSGNRVCTGAWLYSRQNNGISA